MGAIGPRLHGRDFAPPPIAVSGRRRNRRQGRRRRVMRPKTTEGGLARWLIATLVACAACASGGQGGGAGSPAVTSVPAADANRMLFAAAAIDSGASATPEPAEYEIGPGD